MNTLTMTAIILNGLAAIFCVAAMIKVWITHSIYGWNWGARFYMAILSLLLVLNLFCVAIRFI